MNGIRQFELLEDLRPSSGARAILLIWNGQEYIRSHDQIVVFDFVGKHGDRGERGYAHFSSDSNRWELIGGLYEPYSSWMPTGA